MKRPDDSNPNSISYRTRRRRFAVVERIIRDIVAEQGKARILDAGGRSGYWKMLPEDLVDKVDILVTNIGSETTFDTGLPAGLKMEMAIADACDMPQFGDDSFDLCHSNSVIEHVGSLQAMGRFATETTRVARSFYHQTPNLAFPIEPHYGVPFVHWLPSPARVRLLNRMRLGYANRVEDFGQALAAADHTQILSSFMMRQLFPGAMLQYERFYGLPKSIMVFNR